MDPAPTLRIIGVSSPIHFATRPSFLSFLAAAALVCSGCTTWDNATPIVNSLKIVATDSPKPNANSWNNTNVIVNYVCSDGTAAIANCPPAQTVTTEGSNQVVSGTATDNEGNSATARVTISIDKTAPTVNATQAPGQNASGWNNSNVTVSFACADSLSGVASCSAPVLVSTEGTQVISGTATDVAGNSMSASLTVNLDKTGPALSITAPANGAVVTTSGIAVVGNVSDPLSGVSTVTCNGASANVQAGAFSCPLSLAIGANTVSVQASDLAGNISTQSETISLVPPPTIALVNPSSGQQGQQQLSVSITGQFTHFIQGTTTASFRAGIAVASLTVNSATSATALLNIDPAAAIGPSAVNLTTGAEVATLANGFAVTAGTPALTQVNPNAGQQGQQSLLVIITGQYTHFVQATTVASFGAGITVQSLTVTSATTATADLSLSATAAIGAGNVTLTTGTEVETLVNGFTVVAGSALLTQVSPNTGAQGQQALSLVITGQNTHFVQGTTTANFGAAITIASLTVNSANSANAVLNVSPTAPAGPIAITMTTGAEAASLANGFIVTNGTPVLTLVNPDSGQQGQLGQAVALTGDFTHWLQAATTASFGPGITVASLTVHSPSSATALLNEDCGVAAGDFPVLPATSHGTAAAGYAAADFATGFPANNGGLGPIGLAFDSSGNLFISDQVAAVFYEFGPNGGAASAATQLGPSLALFSGATFDTAGNLYVGDAFGARLLQVNPTTGALIRTVIPISPPPTALAMDPISGDLFVSLNLSGGIVRISGVMNGPVTQTLYANAGTGVDGMAFGADGTLYAAVPSQGRIAKIAATNSATPGVVTYLPVTLSTKIDGLAVSSNPGTPFLYVNRNDGIITKVDLTTTPATLTDIFSGGSRGDFVSVGPDGCLYATQSDRVLKVTNADGSCLQAPLGPLLPTNASCSVAQPGPRTVSVKTGSEVVSLANAFTVAPGTPIITRVNPNAGQQGQQNISLVVTGKYTHFVQGTTTSIFGEGITVASLTVTSATSATIVVNIDPAAPTGASPVTLVTGTEVETLSNGFTVIAGTPVLTQVSPNAGQQGQQSLAIGISGQYTHFVQGTTTASFGAGITVVSLAVDSPTSVTALLNIDPTAPAGAGTVTLTTGAELVTLANGFTVTAGTPVLTQTVNPNSGQQGQQGLSVAITGQFTHFVQGTTTGNFGVGITVASLTVNSATSVTAVLNIDPAATTGPRNIALTTGPELVTLASGFTVMAGTPVVTHVSPNTGVQGQQSLSVAITGQYTHFVQWTTTASFGAGITVGSLTVSSPTSVTAVLNIDLAAAVGPSTVTLTTGAEVVTLTNGFTVTAVVPVLTQTTPNLGQQGQQNLMVVITGKFTHFVQGTTTASFGAGITVSLLAISSSTAATAVLNIDPAAVVGARSITLTTGAEVASLNNGFTVTAGTPVLTQVNPNNGQQGQAAVTVALGGQYTHWVQGTTTANFGTGITVVAVTVISPTNATATINIDPAAGLGLRTVAITTNLEAVSAANGFTVIQGSGPSPAISVAPNVGILGQSIQVTITGLNSHFQQGITEANFGPGISVGSGLMGGFGVVQVISATTATAQVNIAGNASPGLRTIAVQSGAEQAALVNGFAVNGIPALVRINPYTGTPGQSLSVLITGIFTNFQQGVTLANFGSGISVGGGASGAFGPVTVTSLTSATAQVSIDTAAAVGLRNPVVTTGTESAALNGGGFLVLAPVSGLPPVVAITAPVEGQQVTAPTTISGTVTSPNLGSWTLDYEASGSTVFTTIATGTTSSVSGQLDPTLLLNGIAQIRLTAVDQSGQTTQTSLNVVVAKNMKVGNFTLSFNDLTVPVAGIPIQITRTYDSRNKSVGDFGFGWTLGIETLKIDKNAVVGNTWLGTVTSGTLIPTYCIQDNQPHVLSFRLQDGTVYQFQPTLNPQCATITPPQIVDVLFVPVNGTPSNASLTATNSTSLIVSGAIPGPVTLFDASTATTFDPDQFQLTLPTGQTLLVSTTFGVQSIADTNGNTLTISSNGISSSAGKAVTFARDSQNRITTITDPSSKILTYAYDANGDLATFTDQLNNISTFTYDASHDLLTFKDPRGIQPLRNIYDDSGRLIQQVDAFGNVLNFNHNIAASTDSIQDFLGNITTYVYDADGNVISTTDPLGNVTSATFDAHDNKLSEKNALGNTSTYTYDANNNRLTETDPLGHTTTSTYNSLNQVLTSTDALGRLTTNNYDANGNLLSTVDPAGNSTSSTYNAQGLRTTSTDALGGVTSFQYDAAGALTQQTDPLGKVTSYTYDLIGNKLTETRTRTTTSGPVTQVTSYAHDALNRLSATTYPDGSTTQIQYNAIGKQSVNTDQLGRQTSYEFDLMGRLTQTAFPDGTSETSAYDALGNRISSTDRGGRTTTYAYDPLKRLVGTTYPDGASTSTTYDGDGEVTVQTDARGNQTKSQYDVAGRRITSTDALNHATTFAYDAAGNQISMTDANGNTTQYQYDALDRRAKTVYPDATNDAVTYDALGRTASKTDQAGQVTQFQYDKLGRLTQVIDALSQVTKYAYDEVGNRISQTDANNHATTFAYDNLGRRIARTLPLGMKESQVYDSAGNLISKTDFNGKTTTYNYDLSNRLTGKTPDASFAAPTVTFAYTATGRRQTMADAGGSTSYTYDLRDRLTQKAAPQGTLSYTYDLAGDLLTIQSSHTGGASVTFTYDALNRLSTAQDNRLASGTTTYSYDNVGNLQGYSYPNGVQTAYTYNTLNRLTNLTISKGSPLASYAYQLGPTGNRTQVSELSGRQVGYTYDALYRLTGETISGGTVNGSIGYQYDPVGNRLQRTSNVAPVAAAAYTYDANDRLGTDTYDADGNTTGSGVNAYAYDFENRLISENAGAVNIVYDGDGNRVAKIAGGVTTKYLVDDRNLTGYAQVLEEINGVSVQRVFNYGLSRISQSQTSGTSFYGYDGHGNVRFLTDATGAVSDSYDYDSFGILLSRVGTTPNNYLYAGEQNDPNLNFYYLRARYLNVSVGRFLSMDTSGGNQQLPLSLHKYLYSAADPVNQIDPSGNDGFADLTTALTINSIITALPNFANVAGAGIFSFINGNRAPDAVGFGVFFGGGIDVGSVGVGGIFGYEVVFESRRKLREIEVFGGFEPSSSLSLDANLVHGEVGVFTAWYWNVTNSPSSSFGVIGFSAGGGFYGIERAGGMTTALLFGNSESFGNNNDVINAFGVLGKSHSLSATGLSESAMVTQASAYEGEFTLLGLAGAGGRIPVGIGLAAALINGGAVGAWIHYTYGQ